MKSTPPQLSHSDAAARRLREEILSARLPAGTRLAEAAVASRLGVSRVPVREALFALEREGLVTFGPTGRAFVRELTTQDFEDLFTLRLILEPPGAKLAATRLGEEMAALEENIRATQNAETVEEVTRLDLEFHELILTASRSARLLRMWHSIKSELELWLARLHREPAGRRVNPSEATAQAHLQILAAFRSQTPSTCERIMRDHILGWREWLPLHDTTA